MPEESMLAAFSILHLMFSNLAATSLKHNLVTEATRLSL